MHRYDVLKKLRVKDLPFVAGQNLMKGAENLGPDDSIEPILKQGTWGIGFIGLAETLVSLIGKHHGEDTEAKELGVKIVEHMRQYTDKITEEYKLNWSCYATPAEGLSGKFIKQDQKIFGVIKGVTDKEYYTNSYHIPVGYAISIKDKIDIEAPYHKLCNGGHISYLEVDDAPNGETVMDIINYAYKNTNIGYVGINFHIRYCRNCGTYLQENQSSCPSCGSQDIQGISRVTGYLSLDERFGAGKYHEREDRISHVGNHGHHY
jgi:ribonucleoside-triphosphate reductase